MSILKEDVEHVAQLARLEFSEEEKQEIMKHFNNILGYVDKLNELDTQNVDIVVNPYYIENKFRDDVIEPSMKLEDVIKNAPKSLEEYIVVPKIME
jgi:aspartyl-tRNA(Asn)/glutamyl-tRNA(Gln) amidotransferase subunit C